MQIRLHNRVLGYFRHIVDDTCRLWQGILPVREMDQTLFIHHLFTALAMICMVSRLVCRKILFKKFDFGDYCTMGAMVCAATRGGVIHVVLTWGTNNMPEKLRATTDFTPVEIYRRTIGSKLAITNRPIYNTYLWLQKSAILFFYLHHIHPSEQWKRYISWSYGIIFAATWVAAQIVGFTECDPFHLYWQVVPAPGSCVQAQVQLFVLGILNIITDFMILALPLPMLSSLRTPWRTKIRLYSLCTLGIFIIAITIIRLPINAMHAAVQANRTTWASTELLAAAIVVNAPVLYGAFNIWRQRSRRKSQRPAPRAGASSTIRTIGSGGKQPKRLLNVPKDDEELMLQPYRQTSITSCTSLQDPQSEDGATKKPDLGSYEEADRNRAQASS